MTNTTNVASNSFDGYPGIHWCSFEYNPLSNDPLIGIGYQSGPTTGSKPEAMNDWIQCFNENVPQEAFNNSQAAYVCATADVRDGGILEGFKRYTGSNKGSGSETTTIVGHLCGIVGLLVIGIGMLT